MPKPEEQPLKRKGRGAPSLHQFAFLRLLRQEMQTRPGLTAQALEDELRAEWQEVRAVLKEHADKQDKKGGQ